MYVICVCTWQRVCMWKSKTNAGYLPQLLSVLYFETESAPEPGAHVREHLGSSCLWPRPQNWGYGTWNLYRYWGSKLKSSLQATSTSATEPSPKPPIYIHFILFLLLKQQKQSIAKLSLLPVQFLLFREQQTYLKVRL